MIFFCIADRGSSLGFRLSGVETREASTKAETLEALEVALATESVGVILITEKAASFVKEEIEALTFEREMPLILELPSRGEAKRRAGMAELLKKAMGISA